MKTLLLLVSVLFISHSSLSQVNRFKDKSLRFGLVDYIPKTLPDPAATFEFDLQVAVPEGEFKDVYPQSALIGLGFGLLIPITKTNPLDLGCDLGFFSMAQHTEKFNYYAPGIGDYDVDVTVKGTMTPFHLVARIYPFKMFRSPIQPYVQGLAGFRSFSIKQEMVTYIFRTNETLPPESFNARRWAWSYGFGAGIKVLVKKQLYANFKVDRLFGTTTSYIDPESIMVDEDANVYYNQITSTTNVLRYSLGVHVMIDRGK